MHTEQYAFVQGRQFLHTLWQCHRKTHDMIMTRRFNQANKAIQQIRDNAYMKNFKASEMGDLYEFMPILLEHAIRIAGYGGMSDEDVIEALTGGYQTNKRAMLIARSLREVVSDPVQFDKDLCELIRQKQRAAGGSSLN